MPCSQLHHLRVGAGGGWQRLTHQDLDGVSCHFCHSMVDPIYKPGISPIEDLAVLAGLEEVPEFYGNAMFVLDPQGRRRGPRPDAVPAHELIQSPFHMTGSMCGTCHDVGNVAITKLPNGTYRYNALDQASPTQDPWEMFPLERTYTEWKLSAFADGGVDMGGRFGGVNASTVSSCQDCHMPRAVGQACFFGPERQDLRRHEFAGSGAQSLDIIAAFTAEDPDVDQAAIIRSRAAAVSMLERAATLEVDRIGGQARVRVINESGHKIPSGHIEGRRIWVNVQFLDDQDTVLAEVGGYDDTEARLDKSGTTIFEMQVGLSDDAAAATGLEPGHSMHMAIADTITKDTRIPPRGWNNTTYEAGGAPAVGTAYPDGQHWSDSWYSVPAGAARVRTRLYYQSTPRFYIDHLRDANVTDSWGQTLHDLWVRTGRGQPILMAELHHDIGCISNFAPPDDSLDFFDVAAFLAAFSAQDPAADFATPFGAWDFFDILRYLDAFSTGCP
ncbi:MAG: hypothetical protein KF757_08995 [Phycisphaeraceae bacterium]|nr:hypothetical protein [Phycisphaeraceae bacterium]MCW5762890.1 hypothetical protein [Phycisphaeraceae bacterium]